MKTDANTPRITHSTPNPIQTPPNPYRLAQGTTPEAIELEQKRGPSEDVSYIEFEPITGAFRGALCCVLWRANGGVGRRGGVHGVGGWVYTPPHI